MRKDRHSTFADIVDEIERGRQFDLELVPMGSFAVGCAGIFARPTGLTFARNAVETQSFDQAAGKHRRQPIRRGTIHHGDSLTSSTEEVARQIAVHEADRAKRGERTNTRRSRIEIVLGVIVMPLLVGERAVIDVLKRVLGNYASGEIAVGSAIVERILPVKYACPPFGGQIPLATPSARTAARTSADG